MTPWVQRLIVANVLVYFLQQTVSRELMSLLVFVPAYVIVRPWTLVTYMFLHGSVTHILFNMFGLYMFGSPVEQVFGVTDHQPSVAKSAAALYPTARLMRYLVLLQTRSAASDGPPGAMRPAEARIAMKALRNPTGARLRKVLSRAMRIQATS